jgi:hexosaminidase
MKTLKKIFFTFITLSSILFVSCQKNEKNDYKLIPEPLNLKPATGQFTFNEETRLFLEKEFDEEIANTFFILEKRLKKAGGITIQRSDIEKSNEIVCKLNTQLPKNESYKLHINPNRITIEACEPVGFFYAAQTLRQLLPPEIESNTRQKNINWTVPCCQIEDTPEFAYRGMHLDACRYFVPKEEIKRYIDQLAFLKLNTFHWHLTDDQGWRIEIKKYPKLTETGAYRNRTLIGHINDLPQKWDSTRIGGFYTQEDIKEVVKYAQKRFVNILPEIEMPGHALAALAAYPQYSCTGGPFEVKGSWGVFDDVYCSKEETFGFLQDVLDEVIPLFPNQYIHIGGDECPKLRWQHCPVCQERIKTEKLKDEHELQSYFIKRIGRYLETKGKKIIGWDEILEGGLAPDATIMSWQGTEGGIHAARQGHDVIMTPSSVLYLDYYQSQLPSEPLAIGGYVPLRAVYEYNPIPKELTSSEAKHILGVQANVWTEYLDSKDKREYMIFPRIAALAENAWLPEKKKNYTTFERKLPAFFNRYEIMGINYSKAFYNVMGDAKIKNGKLELVLQTALPEAEIYYTTDGSQASTLSALYTTPIELGEKPVTVNAIPVENWKKLCEPYSQSFIVNKAAGQNVVLSSEPSEKYKGKGGLTLSDCVLGRYPLLGSEWLGYSGKDVEVTIEFKKPVSISKITVSSTNQPIQWIYAPEEVEYFISENGNTFQSIGKIGRDEILKANSKAIMETAIVEIKKIKTVIKNSGKIPKGEPGEGNDAWLFLDEIIVE